jgi:hypothetical protein
MSTVTGTLAVNAAFLQEIKEDSRELRQLLCQSVEMLKPSHMQSVEPRRMVDLLGRLRDQLALHFTLEEAYGYFDDAIDAAPQLSETAEVLRGQHQTLFSDLCAIVEFAEQLLYGADEGNDRMHVADKFHAFRCELERHESREQDLILAAFNDDIGCGD